MQQIPIYVCLGKCHQYTSGERHQEWEKFQLMLMVRYMSNGKTIAIALR